jgi:hypothetical protein
LGLNALFWWRLHAQPFRLIALFAMLVLPKEKAVNDGPQCGVWLTIPTAPTARRKRFVGPASEQDIKDLIDSDQEAEKLCHEITHTSA